MRSVSNLALKAYPSRSSACVDPEQRHQVPADGMRSSLLEQPSYHGLNVSR